MDEVTLVIPGDPVAQRRPRFSRKQGRAYCSQKESKDCITWHVATQWGEEPIEGAVSLDIAFHMKIPASTSRKKQQAMLNQPCLKHWDCDNGIKLIQDCMNGIVFKDDSSVWSVTAKKIWSDDPRTVVKVSTTNKEEEI